MEFKDLSPYGFLPGQTEATVLNFGWLGSEIPAGRGVTDAALVERLKLYLPYRVAQTRGFHLCPFCPPPKLDEEMPGMLRSPLPQEIDGLFLGTAEIRIVGDGRIYAAPDLVVHYVAAHGYELPNEVAAAVRSGPPPGSDEYRRAVADCVDPEDLERWPSGK